MNREEWLSGLAQHLGWRDAVVLPSYVQSARSTRVCNLTVDESGRALGLVSPALGASLEAGAVVAYLVDRKRVNGTGPRLSASGRAGLAIAGWRADHWHVDPLPGAEDRLISRINDWVSRVGEYPAAPVPQRTRTQSTRMVALTCEVHDEVRVRASRSQIEAGAPLCGRDAHGLPCQLRLVEVTALLLTALRLSARRL